MTTVSSSVSSVGEIRFVDGRGRSASAGGGVRGLAGFELAECVFSRRSCGGSCLFPPHHVENGGVFLVALGFVLALQKQGKGLSAKDYKRWQKLWQKSSRKVSKTLTNVAISEGPYCELATLKAQFIIYNRDWFSTIIR